MRETDMLEGLCEGRIKCGEVDKGSACSVVLYSSEPLVLTDEEGLKEIDSVVARGYTGLFRMQMTDSVLYFVLISEEGAKELWRKTGKGVELNSAYVLMDGVLREVRKEVICALLGRMSF